MERGAIQQRMERSSESVQRGAEAILGYLDLIKDIGTLIEPPQTMFDDNC